MDCVFDCFAQHRRSTISEALGQRGVKTRRILIEQPPYVGFAHGRRRLPGSQPRQLQAGAVIVVRVGVAGLFESSDSAGPIAEAVADGAKCEPGGGKGGRDLDGLGENIGGGDKVAARGLVDRPLIAAVGDQIARGNKERAGVGIVWSRAEDK
jgi:hypothetical protein